jgi:dipeptidyl aminopeptidase/acylaminoacyl peptidase
MTRPFTAEDLWKLPRVGQPEVIPGSGAVVVPVAEYDENHETGRSTIHRVERDGSTTALTSDERSSTSPTVSSDGRRMAFLGAAGDDPAQVYVMHLDGGEAHSVTDLPLGATAVWWVPRRDSLLVAAPLLRGFPTVDATTVERDARKDTNLPVVTEDRVYRHWKKWLANGRIDHLFRVDLGNGTVTHLTAGLDRLIGLDDVSGSIVLTPDGTTIYCTLDAAEEPWQHLQFRIHRLPVDGGDLVPVPTGDSAQQLRPRISPDGSTLVYGAQYERAYYADLVRIVAHHIATGTEQVVTADWDRSAGGWEFIDDGALVFHAEDEGKVRLFTVDIEGGDSPLPLTGTGSNHGARLGVGEFWHRHETKAQPPEVAVTRGGHTEVVSTFTADAIADFAFRPAEEMRFTGAEGRPIQAFVTFPPDFDPDRRWPLLQNVHGGPHNGVTDGWHWRWNTQVMAAAGYVVVDVNFHGSSSFGDAFTRSIRGRWGDQPATDIDAATDHMLSLGYIDEERMAIAGGSYGGYLVTWITTETDRYAASICHAGVVDLLGQYASDHTEGRDKAMGGVPWEDMDAVNRWSPMAHTHDIVTPTLVIHGELDYRVVITQGLALYGLLKAKGVPTRLVYYADEGHWIEKRGNALHWWSEFLAWLDRWVN